MGRTFESCRDAARHLLSKSKVNLDSNVVLMGSNYNMFKKYKTNPDSDPHCYKCTNSCEIARPDLLDEYVFEVSCVARSILAEKGIKSTVLIMPADFMKGADWEKLNCLRASYRLPQVFRHIMDLYHVPASEVAFSFESSFRSRAQNILEKIMKGRAPESPDDNWPVRISSVGEAGSDIISIGPIPVGRMVEGKNGAFPLPFCQVICSAFYEGLGRAGFTDFIGIFNDSEMSCVSQGTIIAQKFGYLRVEALLSFFKMIPEGWEMVGAAGYPMRGLE
jgi:hypothetical protein